MSNLDLSPDVDRLKDHIESIFCLTTNIAARGVEAERTAVARYNRRHVQRISLKNQPLGRGRSDPPVSALTSEWVRRHPR
jgi:hypothetical protein